LKGKKVFKEKRFSTSYLKTNLNFKQYLRTLKDTCPFLDWKPPEVFIFGLLVCLFESHPPFKEEENSSNIFFVHLKTHSTVLFPEWEASQTFISENKKASIKLSPVILTQHKKKQYWLIIAFLLLDVSIIKGCDL
jgi:hypothetical protein